MPLLSIIVTVYNLERYIGECLDSVLNQDFDDYEIVLVDNASTDGSLKICEAYAKKYKKINFIKLEGESIVGRAHRVGIAEAKGTYIHLLDGDDYVANECYSGIVKIILDKEPDVLIGSFKAIPEKGASNVNDAIVLAEEINNNSYEAGIRYIMKLPNFHMVHWRYIFKKSIYLMPDDTKDKLYTTSIPSNYYGDVLTTTRVLIKANSIYYYDKPFYCYRIRTAGAITSEVTSTHYKAFFSTIFTLLHLIEKLNCNNARRDFIFSRIINLFKLFSSGVDIIKHRELSELAKIIDNNLTLFKLLNEVEDKNIKAFNSFVSRYGSYDGLYLYCAYKRSELLSKLRGKENKDIYVFPSGYCGISTARILKDAEMNICGILDNDEYKNNKIISGFECNIPVQLNTFERDKLKNTFVVIATIYDGLIPVLKKQLLDMQLCEEQIILKE